MHINTVDAVQDCAYVVTFLSAAFGILPQRSEISLSYAERTGLALILNAISQRLTTAADALANNQTTQEVL